MTDIRTTRADKRWQRTRRGVRVAFLTALLVVAAGCGRQPNGQAEAVPSTPAAAPKGATLAIAGTLFNGSDPDQIRAYLQTVQEIKPIKFDVQWSPATVPVSKQEAMRALLGVSRDGSTFRFARAEPVVARIKPDSILWIYDLAVAHVDSVATDGDIVVVHTSPASLTQMFTHADIQFDAAPNLQNLYVGFRPHLKPAPTPTATVPSAPWMLPSPWHRNTEPALMRRVADDASATRTPRLMPAVWYSDDRPTLLRVADDPAPGGSAPDDQGDDPDGDYGMTRPLGDAMEGELMGFEYSLGYNTSSDGASLMLEARKNDGDDTPKEDKTAETEKKALEAQADLKKQLHELAELKGKQLTDEASLNDIESEYNREMTKLNSSIPDPQDRARAQQSATTQYQRQRSKLQDELAAIDKARDAVNEIRKSDKERLDKLAEAGKHLKELFKIVSDNLDVRFRVMAQVSNFSVAGAFKVTDGKMDRAAAQFKNLKGRVHLDFVARMGEAGNGVVKVPVVHLPYVFNIPFPVGGLPLVIQLGTDFSATVFLAGMHATQQFSGDYAFSGSEGFKATKAGADDQTTMHGEDPKISAAKAQSPGVSGLMLAIQMPRVGMGLGAFGASSVAYVDVVNVITMTNGASVSTGMMFMPLCTRTTYSAVGSVGIDTHVMPLPIPFLDNLTKKLSTRKQVFEYHRGILDPPVKGCQV